MEQSASLSALERLIRLFLSSDDSTLLDCFKLTQHSIGETALFDLNSDSAALLGNEVEEVQNLVQFDRLTLILENNKQIKLASKGLKKFFWFDPSFFSIFKTEKRSEDLVESLSKRLEDLESLQVCVHKTVHFEGNYFQLSFSRKLGKWVLRNKKESLMFDADESLPAENSLIMIKEQFVLGMKALNKTEILTLQAVLEDIVLCCTFVSSDKLLFYTDEPFIVVDYGLEKENNKIADIADIMWILSKSKILVNSKEVVSLTFNQRYIEKINKTVPFYCSATSKGLRCIVTNKNNLIKENFKLHCREYAILKQLKNILAKYSENRLKEGQLSEEEKDKLQDNLEELKENVSFSSRVSEVVREFYQYIIDWMKYNFEGKQPIEAIKEAYEEAKVRFLVGNSITRCKFDFEEEVNLEERVKLGEARDDEVIDAQSKGNASSSRMFEKSTKNPSNHYSFKFNKKEITVNS